MKNRSSHGPWRKIGSWSQSNFRYRDEFEYSGSIPYWIRAEIPQLLGQLFSKGHPYLDRHGCLRVYGRKTIITKGRHYLYKITFEESDESNDGNICRRPL